MKATISIPKMAEFRTKAVTKDDVDADFAVLVSDLQVMRIQEYKKVNGLTFGRGTRSYKERYSVHVFK